MRNNAIAAVEQTAILNFDERAAMANQAGDPPWDIDHSMTTEEVWQFPLVGDDLDHAGELANFLRSACGIATHHDDPRLGIIFMQAADDLPALGVSLSRDCASVDDAQVSSLVLDGVLVSCAQ
jgi:hypothetical protein